MVAPQEKVIPR